MHIVRTETGARLEQGGAILSEILAEPGPTQSVFDVLAACIDALAPGPRIGLLGFAGGGLVAPLRALGCEDSIDAVDCDMRGHALFREVTGAWAGSIRVHEQDAVAWLERQTRPFDLIVEDLSELGSGGETKPAISVTAIPDLIARRLTADGIAVINLLPVSRVSWRALTAQAVRPWGRARIIHIECFENRIAVCGRCVPSDLGRMLRAGLKRIDSQLAGQLTLRSFGK